MNITRNAVWLLGCRITGDFLNLLLFVLISREFGPAGVGQYSYSFAVASFVFVIGNLGIEDYGLREYMRFDQRQRPRFVAELIGTQALVITLTLAALGAYLLLTRPSAATLESMASIAYYQACLAVTTSLFIPAMAQQYMMGRALIDLICRGTAFLYAGVGVYVWHCSIPQALFGYVLAGTMLVYFSRRSALRHGCAVGFSLSMKAVRKLIGILWSFAAVEALGQLFTRLGVIVLSLKVSEAAAGLYATGTRIIEVGLMPLAFMGVAAYPQPSRLYHEDRTAFDRFGWNFIWGVLVAGIVLGWGMFFVAPVLLVPVLGAKYAGAEPVIEAMALLAVIQAIEVGTGRVLFAAHGQVPRAVAISVGAVAALLLNLLLVPRFAVYGSIMATTLSFGLISALYLAAMRGRMGLRHAVRSLLTPLVGAMIGGLIAWLGIGGGWSTWLPALACLLSFSLVAALGFWWGRERPVSVARSN